MCTKSGKVLVKVDPKYFRPIDVDALCGDASKAKNVLGWQPRISFETLVKEMMDADLKAMNAD